MAGDKGNLARVAAVLRSRLPDIAIVIAADIEAIDSVEMAARSVGGRIVVPTFPTGATGTNFNDLAQAVGKQGTAEQLLEATGPDIWPEPASLPDDLPRAIVLARTTPARAAHGVTDITDRVQCPLDYPSVSAMTALGAVVGRQLAIRPKRFDSWAVVPNLWAMVIGRPGVMKTNAIKYALQPIETLRGVLASARRTDAAV
jgi:putative DNA primase/helicase